MLYSLEAGTLQALTPSSFSFLNTRPSSLFSVTPCDPGKKPITRRDDEETNYL